MEVLAILFGLTTLISGGILIWLHTKSGKKWMANL